MKPTQEQLRAAKEKLSKEIGHKTGISYVGIGTGELRLGYRPDRFTGLLPTEVDGIHVRAIKVSGLEAYRSYRP